VPPPTILPEQVATLTMPTPLGEWDLRAFDRDGSVHLCLIRGTIGDGEDVLVRLHSECLTGDVLGSLRCDCGVQFRHALREIAAEGRGAVVYSTGHEGRGIGLVHKLKAYMLQDSGLDTVQANEHLGLPVDRRTFEDAAACLLALGVRSVRLLSNNPKKERALEAAGISVLRVIGLATAANARSVGYLTTKRDTLGHASPMGVPIADHVGPPPDVSALLGTVRPSMSRPYVILKYAQTLDGRIATSTGDARWISGEHERRTSHALRAASDAVLVGVGTVLRDDPQLTVRMVPGPSPIRVVLDSTLRLPEDAGVLEDDAATWIVTTDRSSPARRAEIRERGVRVLLVPVGPAGLDLEAALIELRAAGIRSLLVEGGARVITSFLSQGDVDRLIVSIAPRVLGAGTEAVRDLGITEVGSALRLRDRRVHLAGDDVVIAGDLARSARGRPPAEAPDSA
jgi:GTP cyclohydrolase II